MPKSEGEQRGDEALRTAEEERDRLEREGHSMAGQGPPGASPNVQSEGPNEVSPNMQPGGSD